LSASLLKKLHSEQMAQARYAGREISLFVKGDAARIRAYTETLGGTFKYMAGEISAIRLPLNRVADLDGASFVTRIEDNDLRL